MRRLECCNVWRMRVIMSVFWSRIQSGRAAVVKRRPNSIWLPYVFSAAYNGGKCGTPPSAAHTRAGTGKKKHTHTCNKIKMIKRRGRDVMWRGRKKKIEKWERNEWWMNESSCWWGRCCQRGEDAPVVHRQSVSQSVSRWYVMHGRARVCARVRRDEGLSSRGALSGKILRENWPETAFLSHEGGKATAVVHERKWCAWERGDRKKWGERSECVTAGQLYWAEEGVI